MNCGRITGILPVEPLQVFWIILATRCSFATYEKVESGQKLFPG